MGNITLGRYMPLDSPVHKMDPRAKIMAMLLTLIAGIIPSRSAAKKDPVVALRTE